MGTGSLHWGNLQQPQPGQVFSSLGWALQWTLGLDTCGTLSGSGLEQVREGTIHLKSLCGLRDEDLMMDGSFESLRLEKTSKIIEYSHELSTVMCTTETCL